jgi:lipid II:glycine glycyltransferase (peptidoglycan interpeptide bridge formation enzyme)
MNVQILKAPEALERYDLWIKQHPYGNLWQSLERKKYLEALGKEVRIYASEDGGQIRASALVMIDRTTGGFSTWDIPRGPIWEVGRGALGVEELLHTIISDANNDKCLALYLSPISNLPPTPNPLHPSPRHIHCEATRIIDLKKSEEDILSQMKQKGRYNIKVSQKHGVTVKESDDIDAFYDLVSKTGKRDGFTHLSKNKYQAFLESLPGAFLLLAYDKQTEPIAGVLSVVWNQKGVYYYGASNHAERAKMAPYLLQLESMRFCKAKGCTEYDLLGISPENADPDHPWAGISSFKEKFGGEVVEYPQEQMMILKPMVYRLLAIKRALLG